jgi:hypothetical protein
VPARTITIAGLGDFRQLQTELERTGVIADKSGTTIADSSKRAGLAAAEQAKLVGASADQQVAAAGRAAAAFADSQEKMSRAQKAAASAAAEAGKAAGLSADEQVAAARRAADAQKAAADEQIAATKKAADASKAAADAHSKISKVGGVVALGAVGAAVEAVKLGTAYQTAQAAIQGATGQSVKEVAKLTGAFSTLGTGSQAAAGSGMQMEAAYASVAGQLKLTEGHALSTAEATKFSAAANNLAESGAASLSEAYSATAKVMQTYHLSANQAAGVTDTLYSTSKAVHVPVEQIASAMGKLHAGLGAVAPSMQDVSGLMVSLAEHGLVGGKGIQVVASGMQTLLGGSKPVASVLKDLGVTLTDSSGKFIGMEKAIGLLQPKLAALPENERRYAEQTLLGKGATEKLGQVIMAGVPAYDAASAAANKHAAAQKAAEAQAKTFKDEMESMKHTVETLGGDFGLILIPPLQKVATVLFEGISVLEKHKDACIALGAVITGVLGTAVAVFAYDKAVAFGKGVTRMTEGLKSLVTSSRTTAQSVEADQAKQTAAVELNAGKMEEANATTGESFTGVSRKAAAGETAVAGSVGTEAEAVTTADGTIADENIAAGASFSALLGPIGLFIIALQQELEHEEAIRSFLGAANTETTYKSPSGGKAGKAEQKEIEEEAHGNTPRGTAASQEAFGAQLATETHLSPGVIGKWEAHEQPMGSSVEGGANWLNVETGEPGGGSGPHGPSAQYMEKLSTAQAAKATAEWLKRNTPGIIRAAGKGEAAEIAAIEGSGFAQSGEAGLAGIHGYNVPSAKRTGATGSGNAASGATGVTKEEIDKYAGGNAALRQAMEEQAGLIPKKKAPEAEKEYLGANNQIVDETAAQHAHKALLEKKAKAEGKETTAALGIPVGVATMLKTAESLIGAPYTTGGGHGSSANDPIAMLKQIGVDCSGFVSKVLSSGGVPNVSGLTTQGLSKNLAKGPGKYVTVEDRPEGSQAHTIIDILGKWFESGGKLGGGVKHLTKAQAGQELAGGGFEAFHPAGLNAAVKGGVSATGLKQITSAAEAAEKAETKRVTALETAAKKMLGETTPRGSLASANQSATVPQLEKVLGVTTGGAIGKKLSGLLGGSGGLSQGTLEHNIMPVLGKSSEASGTGKAFDKLISELKAVHTAATEAMVVGLEQAHRQALANLGRELYAVTQEKEAQQLTNEATEQKDRTTQAANLASKELQVAKDTSTQVTDAMSASATQIDDATTIIKDSFAEMVEAVSNATQKMADIASGEVTATQDTTATKIAELGERGKYGLELIAQKLEVQLDQMKETYDVQIQQAKMALDQAKISGQALIAEKQQGMDLLQAHEDALVGVAQAHSDAVQVAGDQQEVIAQGIVDAAQISSDARTDATYLATVLVAGGTKAQQDAAKGMQTWATASGVAMMANAEAHNKTVEAEANKAIQGAQANVAVVTGEAKTAISNAQQALALAEGSAKVAIANAEQGLTSIEGTAKVAEAKLEGQVAIKREEATTQYAGSGLVVNQYGMNPEDAAANASELGWVLRQLMPLP